MKSYYKYWGKADRNDPGQYHLLPYHCLDVAAVASVWWELSPPIRKALTGDSNLIQEKIKAWVLFFVSLHDIGKFDIRFQLKVPHVRSLLQKTEFSVGLSVADSRNYYHGPAGLYWIGVEFDEIVLNLKKENDSDDDGFLDFGWEDEKGKPALWNAWQPWLEAVTGHHGHITAYENNNLFPLPLDCPKKYVQQDQHARRKWVVKLESLFLKPVGVSLQDVPPELSCISFLAGFCSISDWLGSANSDKIFPYILEPTSLWDYFRIRLKDARQALQIAGLVAQIKPYKGVKRLIKEDYRPHQIQTLIDGLDCSSGMTIIEAPTGSGKTEAALAFAWQLLHKNQAESIIFALPTQATANAMLSRLKRLSIKMFKNHANILLAHGSARSNEEFAKLRDMSKANQGNDDEAWAQCSEWLAQSGKRAFLGQIGVCTIDQVLISVLPVRHRFVRAFGIGRSVLIIDEVHAYDAYMYGLMKAVLKEQKAAGGSVILLSATLPFYQREMLLETWDKQIDEIKTITKWSPYPLISQISNALRREYKLSLEHMPGEKSVIVETLFDKECLPSKELVQKAIDAAKAGAKVAIICNLVDVAQQIFNTILASSTVPLILFHSRFTLEDRHKIEKLLLHRFGEAAQPDGGAILVATQVVEQSLDVDFDWIITQLCPVDLLFQRLGRLHRHRRKDGLRPKQFRIPGCTILLPSGLDYGLHGLIYANTRIMWRTAYKIKQLNGRPLVFPDAYRSWVEEVYQENSWGNEPVEVEDGYQKYLAKYAVKKYNAQFMVNSAKNMTPLADDDQRIMAITRDDPMSLTIIPYISSHEGSKFRNNQCWEKLNPVSKAEALALNKVSVPHTWRAVLDKYCEHEEGLFWLEMEEKGKYWGTHLGAWELRYDCKKGLEIIR